MKIPRIGQPAGMKNVWGPELRTIELVQEDLRRRLEALDRQVVSLRERMAVSDEPKEVPEWDIREAAAPVKPPPLPDALPVLPTFDAQAEPPLIESEKPRPEPKPAKPKEDLELRVGRYWLVRVGILVLLTGLVLLGNLAYQNVIMNLGPAGKLALLYLAGAGLLGLGAWLDRRVESARNYGRVLLAGGAATIYYTTYAAHFVAPLRVIESPLVGGLALLFLSCGLVWFAERRRSERVAFVAVLLAFYTSAINSASEFTLFSNGLLTLVAVGLLVRHRWSGVSWLALAGAYGGFAYWRWLSGGGESFWPQHAFLAAYWVIFTVAVFWQRGGVFREGLREMFLSVNNAAFFALVAPAVHASFPGGFWIFAMGYGGALLALGLLARRMRSEDLVFDGAYFAQGLLMLTIGLVARFSGYQLAVIFGVESMALLVLSQFRHRLLFGVASGLAAGGAFLLALSQFSGSEPQAALVGSLVTAILLGNAVLAKVLVGRWARMEWSNRSAAFGWAGLILLAATLAEIFTGADLIRAFLVVVVGIILLLRGHRMPEFVLGGQVFLLSAFALLVPMVLSGLLTWTTVVPVLLVALWLMHWWQRWSPFSENLSLVLEAAAALLVCGVIVLWADFPLSTAMLFYALTGGVVLAYGLLTRATFLAVLSQMFSLAGILLCFQALLWRDPSWHLTLITIGLAAAPLAARWMISAKFTSAVQPVFLVYRTVLLALSAAWLLKYVPEAWLFLVFAALATGVFVLGAFRKNREAMAQAAVLAGLGVAAYLFGQLRGNEGSGADFCAMLLLLTMQQIGRRWLGGTGLFPCRLQSVLVAGTLAALWYQVSYWVWDSPNGLTVAWAFLAFAMMGAGLLLRERTYRLVGLVVLASAVGKVFLFDVWGMGQFAGILGMIGLALVLLALGFVYNRFAESLKRWL